MRTFCRSTETMTAAFVSPLSLDLFSLSSSSSQPRHRIPSQQAAAQALVKRGPLQARDVARFTGLSASDARAALLVLLQFDLATAVAAPPPARPPPATAASAVRAGAAAAAAAAQAKAAEDAAVAASGKRQRGGAGGGGGGGASQMLQLLLLLLLLPSLLPLLPSPLAHRRSSTRPTLRDCSSYCATRVASATRS